MSQPQPCTACGNRRVANKWQRFCYDCMPGGPLIAPPCRRCGSTNDYFTSGLCIRCHQYAPPQIDGCLDCHAWGVTRLRKWLCTPCDAWRKNNLNVTNCATCDRIRSIGEWGLCRLCWRTATTAHIPRTPVDFVKANSGGQQLFFANMHRAATDVRHPPPRFPDHHYVRQHQPRQLDLFTQPLTWAQRHNINEPPDAKLAARLDQLCGDHGRMHGWARKTITKTQLSLRTIQSLQTTPGEPFTLTEITAQLATYDWAVRPVQTILTEAGLLNDDRIPAVVTWFETQIASLPAQIRDELRVWFDVLHNGRTTPPRSRPRAEITIRTRVDWALPTIQSWADTGHKSLREITRNDIVDALPGSGTPRATLGAALKSIFRILKAQQITFINPTTRMNTGTTETRQPLPVELGPLREALNSPNSATAALTALVAYHGLRASELRHLQLTDITDGRIHVPKRTVLLAEPARQHINRYINDRNQRWPNTANPHLFINTHSAMRTEPAGVRWMHLTLGRSPKSLREDRILDEAIATGGDIRRLSDLFGISIKAATRYTQGLGHPALNTTNDTPLTPGS